MSWLVQLEIAKYNLENEVATLKGDKADITAAFNMAVDALEKERGHHSTKTLVSNNNPGGLVKGVHWKGEVKCAGRFECFKSPLYGIRAMAKTLRTYKVKYGINTIEGIINRWAPPHENNTKSYIRFVNRAASSSNDTIALIKAMITFENGHNPYSDDLIKEAVRMI